MPRTNITDDPRLTAYALGELNASDRTAVEQQIGESVETLLEIEAIREVAGQLRAALHDESLVASLPTPTSDDPASISSRTRKDARRLTPAGSPDLLAAAPKLASASVSTASPHKFSGKLAVAASCFALAGAFGIVAVGERSTTSMVNQKNGITVAQADFRNSIDQLRVLNESLAEFDGNMSGNGVDDTPDIEVPEIQLRQQQPLSKKRRLVRKDHFAETSASGYPTAIPQELSNHLSLSDESAPVEEGVRSQLARRPSVRLRDANQGSGDVRKMQDDVSSFQVTDRSYSLGLVQESEELVQESKEQARYLSLSARLKSARNRTEPLERQVQQSAEAYAAIHDNPFASPLEQPLSTFSIDVDTAAYSNMRRFLTQGSWPPADAVRIEELVNYFSYDYAPSADAANLKTQISDLKSDNPNQPFATHLEVAACPWNAEHRLVRIGLKGKEIALDKRPVSNIVFLIDVSGSMQDANKLPLVKAGLRRFVDQLNENDRLAIVVYAGASGLALDSTNATQKDVVLSAIENLQAGGSTNGGEGIQLAYTMARKHFIPKGTNRVILCTDGDFNVGITDQNALTRLIEEESKSGVFLSVLGFGMGNLKDATLEKLADKGNGHYAYIDSMREAHKVFVEQMTGTLITIAKDVKIQIEFNPAKVGAYRLIGYENRLMAARDFHDDTKDAGEIGAGHTVTALYEIVPPDKLPAQPKTPADGKLKYQPNVKSPATNSTQPESKLKPQISDGKSDSPKLLTIKLRYKQPDADKSDLIEQPLMDTGHSFAQASPDFRFAASVAAFGMILRHSPHRGNATLDAVTEIAQSSLGPDKPGHRAEFLGLVRAAKTLRP